MGEVLEVSGLKYKRKKIFFFQSLSKSFISEAEDTTILKVGYENEQRQDQLQGSEAQSLVQSWSHLLVTTCTSYRPSSKEDEQYLVPFWIKIQRCRSHMNC